MAHRIFEDHWFKQILRSMIKRFFFFFIKKTKMQIFMHFGILHSNLFIDSNET